MPHDANGQLLTVGDRVVLRGKVKSIDSEQPTFCNIQFQTDRGIESSQDGPLEEITHEFRGGGQTYCLSARMVEKEAV